MSSTNRGAVRNARDFYVTPAWCVHALLNEIGSQLPMGAVWFEPCVGNGAIVTAVDDWMAHNGHGCPDWILNDIQPELPSEVFSFKEDYLTTARNFRDALEYPTDSLVGITNPPFSAALEVTQRMLKECDIAIVLQSLNWLGSASRCKFFQKHRPHVFVLPDRPSFTPDGQTDSIAYAWYVFRDWLSYDAAGVIRVLDSTPVEYRRPRVLGSALP